LNVNIASKKRSNLSGPSRYIPQLPAAPKKGQNALAEEARHTIPTKLIEVAENAKRSAMGDAINPYA
jgi:hypothetical protein